MVERDKNHPSASSCGRWATSAGTGANLAAMAEWIRARDPGRPIHYEGDRDSRVRRRLLAACTPTTTRSSRSAGGAEPPLADPAADAHRRALPFILCEYAHAMGNGPGGLADYQQLFETYDRAARAASSGSGSTTASPRTDDGRRTSPTAATSARSCTTATSSATGCSSRTAPPPRAWPSSRRSIEPVRSTGDGRTAPSASTNRHDFADLSHLAFAGRYEVDGETVGRGRLDVPPLAGGSRGVQLPAPADRAAAARRG